MGDIESMAELREGKFPKALGQIFTAQGTGLFPSPKEISLSCSCPDCAKMCKHVAATLYGVGARLDENPMLFFTLRNVDAIELVAEALEDQTKKLLTKAETKSSRVLENVDLSAMFDIDLEGDDETAASEKASEKKKKAPKSKAKKDTREKTKAKAKPVGKKKSATGKPTPNKRKEKAAPAEKSTPNRRKGKAAPAEKTTMNKRKGKAAPAEKTTMNKRKGKAAPAEKTTPNRRKGKAAPAEKTTPNRRKGKAAPAEKTTPNRRKEKAAPAEKTTPNRRKEKAAPAEKNDAEPEERKSRPGRKNDDEPEERKSRPDRKKQPPKNGKCSGNIERALCDRSRNRGKRDPQNEQRDRYRRHRRKDGLRLYQGLQRSGPLEKGGKNRKRRKGTLPQEKVNRHQWGET